VATRRDVTDSPSEQGLEVGPSGLGSPLNVRTRKHPAREVSTSGCGPVRCRRVRAQRPNRRSLFGVRRRLPILRDRTRRSLGSSSRGFGLVAPSARPAGGRTGIWSPATGVVLFGARDRSWNAMTWGSAGSPVGSELHRGTFRDVHAPVRGLPPRRDPGGTVALRACGPRAAVARSSYAGRTRAGNGRKATAAVTRYG
jgi:hypothetical protein